MNISTKSLWAFVLLMLVFTATPIITIGQNSSYLGKEKDINKDFLRVKADNAVFADDICTSIYQDEKNSYYCINISSFESKFEEIRLLEYSYSDRHVVSLGKDNQFLYFLVDNVHNLNNIDVVSIFKEFHEKAIQEKESLNAEQMRLWLIQHDKDTK